MNLFTRSTSFAAQIFTGFATLALMLSVLPLRASAVSLPTCTVEIVSSDQTFVTQNESGASLLSFVHPAWTATLSGASWIWGDDPVADPTITETLTFSERFGFVGTVTSATLQVASDNGHDAALNGGTSHSFGSSFNNVQSYDVMADVAQGDNELLIDVTNEATPSDPNPANNPAGVLYKLVIEGTPTTDSDCSINYGDVIPVLGCTDSQAANYNPEATRGNEQAENCTYIDTYRIEGYVYHDENENLLRDVSEENQEAPLSGWKVFITDGETTLETTTDGNGFYFFEVPAGTWTITEQVEEDWERITQESHTVTVPPLIPVEESVTLLDSVKNFLVPTAYAAVVGTYGPYNFGNVEVTTSGGGGGGTRVGDRNNNDNNDNDTPDGDVLGASDSAEPLVLGEQVTAVPAGAANTGAGGTSTSFEFFQLVPVALVGRARKHG
ncbi:MAG: hypothetical protein AAB618_02610 [Patescibacteria group bacterium]